MEFLSQLAEKFQYYRWLQYQDWLELWQDDLEALYSGYQTRLNFDQFCWIAYLQRKRGDPAYVGVILPD